jgi:hypothetical protein
MPINKIAQSSTEIEYQNYISPLRTGQSISDTGWTTYVDSPGVNPVDGVSGTANLTWTQNLVNPLNADADLRLVKDASNRQGQGVSIPFTIDNKHLAKVLQITFDMELISGTYSNPIIIPIGAIYTIAGTTCTVTAPHSFVSGQSVNMNFITGSTLPPNGTYIITATTSATFVFTVPSGAATAASCAYTATSDLRISIIQDPEGTPVVIESVNTEIQLGISLQKIKHIATFQTHISIRNYRLCIHVSSSNTPAYTIDFANFRIWEPTQSIGAVITDWQEYAPILTTIQGLGTISNFNLKWRRVGSSLEVRGDWTNGTTTSSEIRIPFPSGLFASSDISRAGYPAYAGEYQRDLTAEQLVLMAENSVGYFTVGNRDPSTNIYAKINGNSITQGSYQIRIAGSVRIAGWGSNVAMSSDSSDGRVVAAKYVGNNSTAINPVRYVTREIDTHNAYNPSTGVFTVPVSGTYQISAMYQNDNVGADLKIRKNGVANVSLLQVPANSSNYRTGGSAIIQANAGDTIDMISGSGNTLSSATDSHLSIIRISAGSQTIALQETVAASYYSAASQTSLTAQVNFGIRIYDTHGAVTVGVGAWRFTTPISGKYLITGFIGNGTSINAVIDLFVNGSLERKAIHTTASGIISFSTTIHLLAGQFFDLRPAASMTVAGSASNDIARSRIDITRIGN